MYRKVKQIFVRFKQLFIIAGLSVLLINILSLYQTRFIGSQTTFVQLPALPNNEDIVDYKQPHISPQRHHKADDIKHIKEDTAPGTGPVKDTADDVANAFVEGKPRKIKVKAVPIAPPQENEKPKEEEVVKEDKLEKKEEGIMEDQIYPVKDSNEKTGAIQENVTPRDIKEDKSPNAKFRAAKNIKDNPPEVLNKAAEDLSDSEDDVQKNAPIVPFRRNCSAVENIYMLKVHKSGSTTLQNIIWRWGFARNLRMLIFPKGFPYPYLKYHETYAPPTAPDFSGKHNIMCEHSIYHKPAIQATMPKNTKNIAILRDPLAQLRSAAEYYGVVHNLVGVDRNKTSTYQVLKTFLMNSMKYEPHIVPPDMYKVRNHVVNMFGFEDWKNVDNQPEFDKFMRQKDGEFFVLILERLSESLVLLRREMCWGIKEILTLPMRTSNAKADDDEEDSIEDLEMEYRAYNPGDYAVYDFFIRKIGYRIDDIVDKNDFWAEVRWYEAVQAKTDSFCKNICHNLKGIADRDKIKELLAQSISFEASAWDSSFDVDGSDCLLMMFNPYLYRNAVKMINYPQLCDPDRGGDKMDSRWTIPPVFCKKDYFKYTIPWDAITDPRQYVHKCL